MKVNEFIEKLKEYEKMATLYKLGTFMNRYQGKYLLCDCSGLIKGTLWGYPRNGKYENNKVPDVSANTIINYYCDYVTSDLSKIQFGWIVWLDGHIGVYIGNNEVIECSPKWENGIQITKLNQRNWKRCGALKWIDYSQSEQNVNNSEKLGTYKVKVNSYLNVRTGPSTNYRIKSKKELTTDGQMHSNKKGGLLNGTKVSVSRIEKGWARIPSGWVSMKYLVKV